MSEGMAIGRSGTDLDLLTAPPAMFEHCAKVYAAMERTAVEETVGLEGGTERVVVMWTGALTGLFRELDLPTPYYTAVMQHLKRMGCVEQYQRGGGKAPSKWVLYRDPTAELYENAEGTSGRPSASTRLAAVEQQCRDNARQIAILAKMLRVEF
jgi:hypothetical protein